jgi:transposase-like protein
VRGQLHDRDRTAAQDPPPPGGLAPRPEEVTGSVSKTCRYYGISRPTFYKWQRRFEEHGEDGLRDGSSRPHHVPHATKAEVVGKIVYLRQSSHFGPNKIAMYLARSASRRMAGRR